MFHRKVPCQMRVNRIFLNHPVHVPGRAELNPKEMVNVTRIFKACILCVFLNNKHFICVKHIHTLVPSGCSTSATDHISALLEDVLHLQQPSHAHHFPHEYNQHLALSLNTHCLSRICYILPVTCCSMNVS